MSYRFSPLAIAAVLVGMLAFSPSAFASGMTESGTTITWNGDSANFTAVQFDENNPEDLTLVLSDDYVEYDDQANTSSEITPDCDDADGTPTESPASVVECTDVDVIRANGGSGDDHLEADDSCNWFCGVGLSTIQAELDGGLGGDDLYGGDATFGAGGGDTLTGGQGDDDLYGGDGEDDLLGGADDDYMEGDDDNDELHGDDGEDTLYGEEDNDLLRAGGGDDEFYGGTGADDQDGGDGNDFTEQDDDGEVDIALGGAGVDALDYDACDFGCSDADDVTLTSPGSSAAQVELDDGDTEEDPENGFDGFENLSYEMDDDASATATTGDGPNSIDGDDGFDEMTPGDGPDFLDMEDENDTANTVDGFPDFVDCGEDSDHNDVDTANADQFDTLVNCEDENITEVESAFEDPDGTPPTVQLTSPSNGAFLQASPGTTMTATASDDVGVTQVIFIDDNTILCNDTTAPYECEYVPGAGDVGRNTLSVWAVDANGQFGADFAEVTVGRFNSQLTTRVNKKDLTGRRKVNATGELELEEGVAQEDGCEGFVRLTVLEGNDRLKRRRAKVQEDCSFAKTIRLPPVRTIDKRKVKTKSKFLGNDIVQKDKAPTKKTKVQ